jgi:hypothetical protein
MAALQITQSLRSNLYAVGVTLYNCTCEVLSSNLGWDSTLSEVFHVVPQLLQKKYSFLSNPLKFLSHPIVMIYVVIASKIELQEGICGDSLVAITRHNSCNLIPIIYS